MKTHLHFFSLRMIVFIVMVSGLAANSQAAELLTGQAPASKEKGMDSKKSAVVKQASIPVIDGMQPSAFETASFGLG